MTTQISLGHGKIALIDDCDSPRVSGRTWTYSQGYAVSFDGHDHNSRKRILMHRLIVDAPAGRQVDHKNRDVPDYGLDNRRSNLRVCTWSQNQANRGLSKSNRSGFRGVSFHKREGKWRAEICVNGVRHSLGVFDSAIEAAKAWNTAAIKHFGEFAYLNPIGGTK